CYGDELLCGDCIVGSHARSPLHRIKLMTDLVVRFEAMSLKSLGLHVQRGHQPTEICSELVPLHRDFTVLHTNGIHEVAVDVCDCDASLFAPGVWAGTPEEQLQRAGWFPTTDDWPRTCTTMELLDNFLLLTYQAKTTMYDFYSTLEKLTNNVGNKPPYRYHVSSAWCASTHIY
ncbi:hypothetical protein K438DRAFT_1592210, partial [Mycena galopus ATCC 62051]